MKRGAILWMVGAWMAASICAAAGALGETYAKAALASLQAIESDTNTTEQGSKEIFDPLASEAKTAPEKSVNRFLRQVYEQKLDDNRLRKAEFDVLDEALNSSSPLIRDTISRQQIAQYDRLDAEMNKKEDTCFQLLKKALRA